MPPTSLPTALQLRISNRQIAENHPRAAGPSYHRLVLREERAKGLTYDSQADVLTVDLAVKLERDPAQAAKSHPKSARVTLLLDARGHLVGVDMGGDGPSRLIVMLGKHEDVSETREVTAMVHFESSGAPGAIAISNARRVALANEKNPYLERQ
jgi:hypothetical protein